MPGYVVTRTSGSRRTPPAPPRGLAASRPNDWLRVWVRVRAQPSVKHVGWACAYFANYDDGAEVRPGLMMLAAVCGELNEKTVSNALKQIGAWGLMWRYFEGSKAGRPRDGRGGLADVWRLTIPDRLLDHVPMLTPNNGIPEPQDEPPLCECANSGSPFWLPDHLISDHLISDPVSPELSDEYHPTSGRATSAVTSPYTQPPIRVPLLRAEVEGSGNGEVKIGISDEDAAAVRAVLFALPPERMEQLLAVAIELLPDATTSEQVRAAAALAQAPAGAS